MVCVDKGSKTIDYFDPFGVKKAGLEVVVKQDFMPVFGSPYRVRYSQPFQQKDGHSCGVFVLMFVKHTRLERVFPEIDRYLLQFFRHRYLSLRL